MEKADISIWEVAGTPHQLLDHILATEVRGKPGFQGMMLSVPQPVEISPGCYRMVLRENQLSSNEISSQQVLDPIMALKGLRRLEIFCDYVPSWLEQKITDKELTGYISKLSTGEAVITIVTN